MHVSTGTSCSGSTRTAEVHRVPPGFGEFGGRQRSSRARVKILNPTIAGGFGLVQVGD